MPRQINNQKEKYETTEKGVVTETKGGGDRKGPVVVVERSLVSSTGVVLVEGVGVRVERSGCGALTERCVWLEEIFFSRWRITEVRKRRDNEHNDTHAEVGDKGETKKKTGFGHTHHEQPDAENQRQKKIKEQGVPLGLRRTVRLSTVEREKENTRRRESKNFSVDEREHSKRTSEGSSIEESRRPPSQGVRTRAPAETLIRASSQLSFCSRLRSAWYRGRHRCR